MNSQYYLHHTIATDEEIIIEPVITTSFRSTTYIEIDSYCVVKKYYCGLFNYRNEYLYRGTYAECVDYCSIVSRCAVYVK